ncbi:hypothetical protein [Streptomyces sp. R41]|uniref:Lipoprotein n=1 Tax=Streptomyces sp. R41 TaxID=3238632 RepID=A0AB39RJ65_9ACTN
MKRTALAAASALSLAAVLTACGGSDQGTDSNSKPEKTTASPAKTLSPAEQVARLMVTKAEAGGYSVRKPSAGDSLAETQDEMNVDKAACTPLAYAMNELPVGTSEASLTRVADKSTGMLTYITLSTYADGKAATAMKDLTTAADSCGSGFTAKSNSGSTTYDSVTVETAPSGSDESLATAATFKFRGLTQTIRTQTFRFGDTIASYFTLDSSAFMNAHLGKAKIPADLVKAQNSKLG